VSLTIDANVERAAVEKAISGHILAQGRIVGTYSK
jgi:phosphatidylethanolamine-binding protein (PEBP) family uncharacterized protein